MGMVTLARKAPVIWQISALVIIWRGVLFGMAAVADNWLSYLPSFPYAEKLMLSGLPSWLYSWGNFDGVHYLTIAEHGYEGIGAIQAFFPVFPLLLRLLPAPLIGGVFLNVLLTVLAAWLLFQLCKLDASNQVARWTVIGLFFFPTSFFLAALYTEPLFLALVLASFLAARKQTWWLAGILAGLASATRVVGIFLWPALVLELWLQTKPKSLAGFLKNQRKALLWLFLAWSGLGAYSAYLWHVFGDPLYFFSVQKEFGAGRQSSLVLFPQVVWRSLKILWTTRPFDWKYWSYAQDLWASLGSLAALTVWFQKIRPSYLLFSLAAFFLPPLTGNLSSMPRYVLVCFPLFFLLGEWLARHPRRRVFLLTGAAILIIINTILFIQGYWVA